MFKLTKPQKYLLARITGVADGGQSAGLVASELKPARRLIALGLVSESCGRYDVTESGRAQFALELHVEHKINFEGMAVTTAIDHALRHADEIIAVERRTRPARTPR